MPHPRRKPPRDPRPTRRAVTEDEAAGDVAAPGPAHAGPRSGGAHRRLLLGSYTGQGGAAGIGVAEYAASGAVSLVGEVPVENPSYLARHPSGRTLYAVNEQEDGGITAVAVGVGGAYEVLGTVPAGGSAPCQVAVHPSGDWLLSAAYGSGSVAVHAIERDGALGALTAHVVHDDPPPGPGQQGPHAHQLLPSPDGRHALACDLGTDTVYSYAFDETAGTLREVARAALTPGAGPRHLTFHPNGAYAYLANELDDTVAVCAYDAATGALTPAAPLGTGTTAPSAPSQFVVTGDGAHAYLGNRGDETLTRYAVEDGGAGLRLLDTVPLDVAFPRHLALSPDGRLLFVGGQRSDAVQVFGVDEASGELSPLEGKVDVPSPVFLLPV